MSTDESTLTRVTLLMDEVGRACAARDHEVAHAREDQAHEVALTHIARHGDEKSKRLATEALRSALLPFERWCS